jgi:hypothetical protein
MQLDTSGHGFLKCTILFIKINCKFKSKMEQSHDLVGGSCGKHPEGRQGYEEG